MKNTLVVFGFGWVVLAGCASSSAPQVAAHDCDADGRCEAQCPEGADPDCGLTKCTPGAPGCAPACEADGRCEARCAKGADPDCARAPELNVTGFTAAAGTVRAKRFQVRGALVPWDMGTTAASKNHRVAGGERR